MIQKDYIMRMIEQMTQILAKVLFKKNEEDYPEATSIVDTAFSSITGIDIRLLDVLSAADIAELFGVSKDNVTGGIKCLVAARLLKERADIRKLAENGHVDRPGYQKALSLYRRGIVNAGESGLDMSGYLADVKEITEILCGSA